MRRIAALLVSAVMLTAQPIAARVVHEAFQTEVVTAADAGSERFVHVTPAQVPQGVAAYGPFRVLDGARAALVDATDERSPAQFAAMLRDHPGIATLELVECPGTDDDTANLALGRMIRAHGLATHVPDGGSVRSGAVELFVAGTVRRAEPGAEFAVHGWLDEEGREPQDYAPDAPENRAYLDYYRQMGMSDGEAAAFYAMTNSVPNASARWLTGTEIARWVRLDNADSAPSLASAALDSSRLLH